MSCPVAAIDSRVRLLTVDTVRAMIGRDAETVEQWIDRGDLVAFDLAARQGSSRRMLRVWRGAHPSRPLHPGNAQAADVLADALLSSPEHMSAERFLGSTELEVAWSCTDDHLRHLASELGGVMVREGQRSIWKFSRRSCAAFLKNRRAS